jgi:hypothetical protein
MSMIYSKTFPPARSQFVVEPGELAPGYYEWHTSKEAAQLVSFPGFKVVKTSPGLWRARVA